MIDPTSLTGKLMTGVAVATLFVLSVSAAEAGGRYRGAHENAAGGTTAGAGAAHQGPNGGVGARGAVVVTDGQGNGAAASGGAVRGPNGGRAVRGSGTTVNADGSVNHQGGAAAQGQNGSAQTQGGFTRNADGTVQGRRTTTATNSNTGNSVQGQTTYDSQNGAQHTHICYDAAGNVIACPTR